jgi:hypothetical protein
MVTPAERREVDRLTRLAGVRAPSTEVTSGDPALSRITGARMPSGVPVAEPPKPVQNPPRRRSAPAGRGRSGMGRSDVGRSGTGRSGAGRPRRAA